MGLPVHTTEVLDGSSPLSNEDRLKWAWWQGLANAAGGAAGASVTVAVSGVTLPANYQVMVELSQDATWYVTDKTQTGFNVVINPRLAANTLAAGTINVAAFG